VHDSTICPLLGVAKYNDGTLIPLNPIVIDHRPAEVLTPMLESDTNNIDLRRRQNCEPPTENNGELF
jgi:hypothetical protein